VFANTSTTSKGAHPLQYPHVWRDNRSP
jgi:hypothetical protein